MFGWAKLGAEVTCHGRSLDTPLSEFNRAAQLLEDSLFQSLHTKSQKTTQYIRALECEVAALRKENDETKQKYEVLLHQMCAPLAQENSVQNQQSREVDALKKELHDMHCKYDLLAQEHELFKQEAVGKLNAVQVDEDESEVDDGWVEVDELPEASELDKALARRREKIESASSTCESMPHSSSADASAKQTSEVDDDSSPQMIVRHPTPIHRRSTGALFSGVIDLSDTCFFTPAVKPKDAVDNSVMGG